MAGRASSADTEAERRPSVRPSHLPRKLGSDSALLPRRMLEGSRQGRIGGNGSAPSLHASGGLDAGDRGDEVSAREVVGRRERCPVGVVRVLLRHRRKPVGAPNRDPSKCARRATELPGDDGSIVHARSLRARATSSCGSSLPPGRNALDDEELLAGPDVPEPTCLPLGRLHAGGVHEPEPKLLSRATERVDLGPARREVAPRLEVAGQRPVVEVDGDRHDDGTPEQAKPPPRDARSPSP